ncbi:MAG: hypothetical protein JEZ02_16780 [Desulfatibacillum sp.]|nr:hypothetical protein [Desulfatibacillum sp.]
MDITALSFQKIIIPQPQPQHIAWKIVAAGAKAVDFPSAYICPPAIGRKMQTAFPGLACFPFCSPTFFMVLFQTIRNDIGKDAEYAKERGRKNAIAIGHPG